MVQPLLVKIAKMQSVESEGNRSLLFRVDEFRQIYTFFKFHFFVMFCTFVSTFAGC